MSSARDLAADLLLRYDRTGDWVARGLEEARTQLADARDRGLLTELALGCVRRQGTLDAVLGAFSARPLAKLNAAIRTALRLGLYQILFLDRVPPHAAVDRAVGWARGKAGPQRAGFVNGVLRSILRDIQGPAAGAEDLRRDVPREDGSAVRFRKAVFPDPAQGESASLAARFSMPRALVDRWTEAFGPARCASILRAAIARPPLGLRARTSRDALADALKEADVAFEASSTASALTLAAGEGSVQRWLTSGEAAVQDATSQRIAPLLEAAPGARVLDLCAAPGGKTLHLADLMGSGTITACDIDADKVAGLEALRETMGAIDLQTRLIDPEQALPFEPASFDAILVDAPCSNTGVLRRRVEARWRLKPQSIAALATLQRDLLERALPLLAPGGRLVYSTCSIEREENEDVLAAFLEAHPELSGEVAFRVWPGGEADGGFAAVIRSA